MELEELHLKLKAHLKNQNEKWEHFIYSKQDGFYQGLDKINIKGSRSTEKRFNEYNIGSLFSKNKNVLDIGSNCGFVSLYTSEFVKSVTGVEINPFLVKISNDTKEFLNIQNVKFVCSTFEEYNTEEKFDIVYSFANDSTIDNNTTFNFEEYIQKILFLLSSGGLLIFESQALDVLVPSKFQSKLEILEKYFIISEKRKVSSEYPTNVPERIFLVLEKK
jgi:ubiquinone/menaquinone biosynthesis C-methylase UbiE